MLLLLVAAAAVGCGVSLGADGDELFTSSKGPGGNGGEIGSGGSGIDAGIDANLGDGSTAPVPLTYAELCGGGCSPGPSTPPCELEGADGGASGELGGCQLAYDLETNSVHGTCAPLGSSVTGMPCLETSDCGLGLGCVAPGVCRPYCCDNLEACPSDTFCQPQAMAAGAVGADLLVEMPVCVPASHCTLLEDSTCPPEQACTIVRVDGTTSCVVPGSGELGEPCPCAAGYVCATALGQCLKLCKIGRVGDCPESLSCQGGSTTYPSGFGVCVGS